MTPKEKAAELIVNCQIKIKSLDYDEAKQCALFTVYEILNTSAIYVNDVEYDYWEQVEMEIEKL